MHLSAPEEFVHCRVAFRDNLLLFLPHLVHLFVPVVICMSLRFEIDTRFHVNIVEEEVMRWDSLRVGWRDGAIILAID